MKKASKNENVVELDLFAPEDFGEEENGLGEEENAFAEEENAFAKEENAKVTKADEGNAKVAKADEASEGEVSSVMFSDVASLFLRLSQSRFRSSFYLNQKDRAIIVDKGMATIREHARQIIARRLAPAFIPNDGRQTPMRHGTSPVFIAQHATACCCRGCLEKWHHIPKGRALTADEQAYVVEVIMRWIEKFYDISPSLQ